MICHYTCDRCGFHRDLQYLPRVYALDDDRTVPIQQRHVWCTVCNDISVCDSLTRQADEVQYLQERLRELHALRDNPPADLSSLKWHRRTEVERAAQWIQDIEQAEGEWQEWRSRRQAPAHCLRCNTPVEQVPDTNAESLKHAGCGGTLECTITVQSFNGPAYVPHLYSIDGVLIKAGRKPRIRAALDVEYLPMELFWSGSEI